MSSYRAPLAEEITFDGRKRSRCQVCGKVAFSSEGEAREAAKKIQSLRGVRMRYYKGRHPRERSRSKGTPCGWWHLSQFNNRR